MFASTLVSPLGHHFLSKCVLEGRWRQSRLKQMIYNDDDDDDNDYDDDDDGVDGAQKQYNYPSWREHPEKFQRSIAYVYPECMAVWPHLPKWRKRVSLKRY